jgi:hypothetical protein
MKEIVMREHPERERDDYNGAVTKLTEEKWVKLAAKRHGRWVVVIDGHVTGEGAWLPILGQFLLSTHAGQRVKMLSHTDYVMRQVAEAALVAT